MKNKLVNNDSGFTLIELIIGVALASIIIVSVYSLILIGTKNYDDTNSKTAFSNDTQYTVNMVADTIISSSFSDTYTVVNGNIYMLFAGNKVLYYNKNNSELCIYNKGETYGETSTIQEHRISNNISEFEITFLDTEVEETTDPFATTTIPTTTVPETTTALPGVDPTSTINKAVTDLVKVKIVFNSGKNSFTSENVYRIRNK